jgi:hypothetical protein
MSKNAGKSEMGQATALMRDNIARLEAIGIPTVDAQKISLESPELVGMLEAGILEPSKFAEISMDPRLQAAQMAVLQEMTGIGESGRDAESKLTLEQGLGRIAGAEQADFQKITEDPTLNAGQKLALREAMKQRSNEGKQDVALKSAAQAQQAKVAALGQKANLASEMQRQQLGLAGQKASAADAINQFNTQLRQQTNIGNKEYERQRAAQVAATKNQQEMYNKGLIQQQFQNQMARVTGVTGAQSNLANIYGQQAAAAQQAQQAQTGALLNLGGTLGAAAIKGKGTA